MRCHVYGVHSASVVLLGHMQLAEMTYMAVGLCCGAGTVSLCVSHAVSSCVHLSEG